MPQSNKFTTLLDTPFYAKWMCLVIIFTLHSFCHQFPRYIHIECFGIAFSCDNLEKGLMPRIIVTLISVSFARST